MALKYWKCQKCNEFVRTFNPTPKHCEEDMILQMGAPQAKFMEQRRPGAKSVLKDQDKMLKARARDHTREFGLDELIANNPEPVAKKNQWVTKEGKKRKKIDDI